MTMALLEPFDSVFFRDGRPFEQTGGLAEAFSLFPPEPTVLSGALIAAIARARFAMHGLETPEKWSEGIAGLASEDTRSAAEIENLLALATGELKEEARSPLRFVGPFLAVGDHAQQLTRLFPAPRTLRRRVAVDGTVAYENLLPEKGSKKTLSDLCSVSSSGKGKPSFLPTTRRAEEEDPPDEVAGAWIREDALRSYLSDMEGTAASLTTPDYLSPGEIFATREPRMGVAIGQEDRVVRTGMLYSASHVRLQRGAKLAMLIETDDGTRPQIVSPVPLGGDGRFASVSLHDADGLEKLMPSQGTFRIENGRLYGRIVALTAVPVDEHQAFGLPKLSDDFPEHEVVAAVAPRPRAVGRWMPGSAAQVSRVFPAGSTWFVKVDIGKKKLKNAVEMIGGLILNHRFGPPALTARGYGACAFGNWPNR